MKQQEKLLIDSILKSVGLESLKSGNSKRKKYNLSSCANRNGTDTTIKLNSEK